MTARVASPSVTITEAQLQDTIVSAARKLGYLVFHDHDSRRSETGFPDLVIVGHSRVIVFECKTAKGKLRPATINRKGRFLPSQEDWLWEFARAGVEAGVIRPNDLDEALELLNQWRDEALNREERRTA
jgi:hypothetical protein